MKSKLLIGKLQTLINTTIQRSKMAWRSKGKDNPELISQLELNGVIKNPIVKAAMLATDRKFYCPHNPYTDAPQTIGHSVTISAPHMHAHALDLLLDKLHPECKVLDVGSGSGYLTACFARAIPLKAGTNNALVVGIEHQPELVKMGIDNISKDDCSLLESGKVLIVEGDGRLGYLKEAPYDAIHVGATSPTIPTALLDQLKNGGRMVCPIGPEDGDQYLEQFDKELDGQIRQKRLFGVRYVPLTDLRRS
ncbi:hypothetical protein HA402_007676 [Bradysia odoriphaga]|nr:hypothetical protein HA402_007676 [Bradysia odoriphaga]